MVKSSIFIYFSKIISDSKKGGFRVDHADQTQRLC